MQRLDDPPELVPLFDEVMRRPADDGPRTVLADALMERGDARGEFISLQLLVARGVATAAQTARAENLLKFHQRRWLSELPALARDGAHFHRGFLQRAVVEPTGQGVDHPLWRSIEELRVRPTQVRPDELGSPRLEALVTLDGVDALALSVVADGPVRPRLATMSVVGPALEDSRLTRQQEDVLKLSKFGALKSLTLVPRPWRHHADRLAWLLESRLAHQLAVLRLSIDPPWDVAGLHGLLVQHRLTRLRLELFVPGWAMHFNEHEVSVHFDDARALERHAQTLRNLGPKFLPFPFSRVQVKVGQRAATAAQLARLGDLFSRHA